VNVAINGTWTNELGSTLVLQDQGNGTLTGTYASAVGGPAGQQFPLVGSYTIPQAGPVSLAWTVAWKGWDSTTSWCGLLFDGGDMTTTWILTSTISQNEGWWQSMNVGMDLFAQNTTVSREDAERAAKQRGASHPLKKRS
jgi:hypothetical protein